MTDDILHVEVQHESPVDPPVKSFTITLNIDSTLRLFAVLGAISATSGVPGLYTAILNKLDHLDLDNHKYYLETGEGCPFIKPRELTFRR